MRRLLVVIGSAIAVLVAGAAFGSVPATAHATLERAEPAANARLATEPRRVVLVFDEPVNAELGHVTVFGPRHMSITGALESSSGGRTITVALTPRAGDGTYVVSYRLVSLDTHPVSGGYYFQVGSGPVAADAPAAAATAAAQDPAVRALYAAARYTAFVGLLLLIGALVFLAMGWADRTSARRVAQQAWWGLALVAAGSIGELVLQAPYASGTSLSDITGAAVGDVVDTGFGLAHVVRLGLVAVAAPVLAALHRSAGTAVPTRRLRAAVLSIVLPLVLTWASYGHVATTHPLIAVPSDMVHLGAVAVWVGGLTVLATAVLPTAAEVQLRRVLPRWSRLAMACVAALVLTGTVQALIEVVGWSGLTETNYGRLLLAKIALLGAVLLVANYSRRWVARWYSTRGRGTDVRAQPSAPAAMTIRGLRRAVVTETLLAVTAVAVAALLVDADPNGFVRAPAFASPAGSANGALGITRQGAYIAQARRGDVVLHLKVDPAVVGVQYIYLDATRPDGRRIRVQRWRLTVSNTDLGLRDVPIPILVDAGVGHYFVYGSFTMKTGGIWTVRVSAQTSDGHETVLVRRVAVRS